MNYKLKVTKFLYDDEKEVKSLKELGFEFEDFILSKEMQLMYAMRNYRPGYKYSIKENYPEHLTIEINTLDELNKFISKHGRIVMSKNEIEIYNAKRES